MKPYVVHSGEGVSGFDAAVKASGSATGGNLTVIESHTKGGAPWHVHTGEDEYFYILAGAIIVRCGAERFTAEQGSFVFLLRGIPHTPGTSAARGLRPCS